MNTIEKLQILGSAAKYDLCASTSCSRTPSKLTRIGAPSFPGLCHSFLPDGRCVSLFKVLYSNKCIHDCAYCSNSAMCSKKTATFDTKELSDVFMNFYIRNYVEGLFLSSGIFRSVESTTDEIISMCEYLRDVRKFQGYIHLKILPGASYDAISRACRVSDRISLNVELPTKSTFEEVSSTKDYKVDILKRLTWIKDITKKISPRSGHTTQFVVGATDETDRELLRMVDWLYKKIDLKRAYFSAFVPIAKTKLANRPNQNIVREHRLYQFDWLLRMYKISFNELIEVVNDNDFIDLNNDPKKLLADLNCDLYPLEINDASYNELIRVPGIGIQSAKKIVSLRKNRHKIKKMIELKHIGVVLKRAAPYIKINSSYQTTLM